MPNVVYQIPDFWLFVILNGFMLIVSFIAVFFIEKFIPVHLRYKENQPIGYISATICLIFAVLAGFASLYVLTNFNKAREISQQEADMAMAIYEDARWLQDPIRSDLQNAVKNYLKNVIEHDWSLMATSEELGMKTGLMINEIGTLLHQYYNYQPNPPFAAQEISKEVVLLRNAREDRIDLGRSALGHDIWIVLILTALLTIAINYLFGMQLYLHFITVCAVSIVVSSMIFLLIVLDHPFQGQYSVGTEAFQHYLDIISYEESHAK